MLDYDAPMLCKLAQAPGSRLPDNPTILTTSMDANLAAYLPLFLFLLFAVGLGTGMVVFSTFLGRRRGHQPTTDLSSYECGLSPRDPNQHRLTVRFYLVAMLFILFDLEVAFLYPWAVSFRSQGWFSLWVMLVFLGLLTIGFIYVWRKGALDWKVSVRRGQGG